MRQIKFRAFDKRVNQMVHSSSFGNLIHPRSEDTPNIVSLGHIEEIILMQFTGLTDKNGKEVFEGDIIEIKNSDFGKEEIERFRIIWGTYSWVKDIGSEYMWTAFDPIHARKCEVIGNIYEHSDLLQK